ncbi:LytR/AlgR family response regulator transcription factor [Butyrivibrio sp. NC3005]|uniref:LytR/AlgR family response regulator transcription factor n=1 Tax=Butyrivibrio sp. NC3005 TaxID=1280685 RepID=UPI003FA406E8
MGGFYALLCCLFTSNPEYISEFPLSNYLKILDRNTFFRCHKSFIVNIGMIDKICDNDIILINGNKVSVSRRLRKSLLKIYEIYGLQI